MNRVTEWLKEKKKIIIIAVLVILLVLIIFLFFGGSDEETSTGSDVVKSESEIRLTALLESIDGVGDVEIMITETDGVITGVVVVCEGANSIMIRNDILNAVSIALNIDKNNIAIYSM